MNNLPNIKRKSGNVHSFLAFLLFICFSFTSYYIQAQEMKSITLNVQNETAENVFNQLGMQTGLKFFYDQDRLQTLESRVPGLAHVVYHNKLGTQLERSERVQKIASRIAEQIGADPALARRAAKLAKEVPIYYLLCTKEPSAAQVMKAQIDQKEIRRMKEQDSIDREEMQR